MEIACPEIEKDWLHYNSFIYLFFYKFDKTLIPFVGIRVLI